MLELTPPTKSLIDFTLQTGECPVWDAATEALYFVDIDAPALFRHDCRTGALNRWPMPAAIGSFGLCGDGRIMVALRTGIYFLEPASNQLGLLIAPEQDRPLNRMNDGKVGPDGAFWVGSIHDRPERLATAALYRITGKGKCQRMLDGLRNSNGLAWSGDGKFLYHADTSATTINRYHFDLQTGTLSQPQPLISLNQEQGRPDGGAMDCQGFYWSAGVTAGCLNRIAPDGTIERKIKLPVAAPTMPCFGGPDMKTLFVTSLTRENSLGTILSFKVDVAGVPIGKILLEN